MSPYPVDLRLAPYGVLVDDEAATAANAKAISQAIFDHPTGTRFGLPMGRIYVSRDLSGVGPYRFAAIKINGSRIHDISLTGWEPETTELVMTGSQAGGLPRILQIADGPSRVLLSDFSISHGPNATDIDTVGLQNHQIELNAVNLDVTDCEIHNVYFGTCIGDAPVGRDFAVDTFPGQQHEPITDHADFINLMPPAVMAPVMDCINTRPDLLRGRRTAP